MKLVTVGGNLRELFARTVRNRDKWWPTWKIFVKHRTPSSNPNLLFARQLTCLALLITPFATELVDQEIRGETQSSKENSLAKIHFCFFVHRSSSQDLQTETMLIRSCDGPLSETSHVGKPLAIVTHFETLQLYTERSSPLSSRTQTMTEIDNNTSRDATRTCGEGVGPKSVIQQPKLSCPPLSFATLCFPNRRQPSPASSCAKSQKIWR